MGAEDYRRYSAISPANGRLRLREHVVYPWESVRSYAWFDGMGTQLTPHMSLRAAIDEAMNRGWKVEQRRQQCPVCGGDGWTEGSAELRRDGRIGDTTCIGCGGTGRMT